MCGARRHAAGCRASRACCVCALLWLRARRRVALLQVSARLWLYLAGFQPMPAICVAWTWRATLLKLCWRLMTLPDVLCLPAPLGWFACVWKLPVWLKALE